MKKIGLPEPLHRLLCVRSRVGGNRDWVVCVHMQVIESDDEELTYFFVCLKYVCESNFSAKECTVHPPSTRFCSLRLFCLHEHAAHLEFRV